MDNPILLFLRNYPKHSTQAFESWQGAYPNSPLLAVFENSTAYQKADTLYGWFKQWVIEMLSDALPSDYGALSPDALKHGSDTAKQLTMVYYMYFADESRSQAELSDLAGVTTKTTRNWRDKVMDWLGDNLRQREALVRAGLPLTALDNLHEYTVESVDAVMAAFDKKPHLQVLGKAGSGKTTCAIHVARALLQDGLIDSIAFVKINIEDAPSQTASRVLDALMPLSGRVIEPDDAYAVIQAKLAQQPHTLVVLDSCEVLEGQEEWVMRLLNENPNVRFLLTSRLDLWPYGSVYTHPIAPLNAVVPLIRRMVGLERAIAPSLIAAVRALEYPLLMRYMVRAFQKDGAAVFKKSASGQSIEIVFEMHWHTLSMDAQHLLVLVDFAQADGISRDVARRFSGFSDTQFATAFSQIISFSDKFYHVLVLHDEERAMMQKFANLPENARWLAERQKVFWHSLTDTVSLDHMADFHDNAALILRVAESQLPNPLVKDTREGLSLTDWQIAAEIIKILFERGDLALLVEPFTVTQGEGMKNISKLLLMHLELLPPFQDVRMLTPIGEIVCTLIDSLTTLSITRDDNNQDTMAQSQIERIRAQLIKATLPRYQPQVQAIMDTAEALRFFNRGDSLHQAQEKITAALNGLENIVYFENLRAYVQTIAALIAWRLAQPTAIDLYLAALAYYESTGQNARRLWVLSNLGLAYWSSGKLKEAVQTLNEAVNETWMSDYKWMMVSNLGVLALVHLSRGDLEAAEERLRRQKQYMCGNLYNNITDEERRLAQRRFESHPVAPRVMRNFGNVYLSQGRFDIAKAQLLAGIKSTDDAFFLPRCRLEAHVNLALCYHHEGNRHEALAQLELGRLIAERPGNEAVRVLYLRALAYINRDVAPLHEALPLAKRSKRPLDVVGCWLQLAILQGDPNRGTLIEQARSELQSMGADGWLARVNGDDLPMLPLLL